MSDHPTAFGDTPLSTGTIAWDDRAALHKADDGDGVLDGAKALRRGTFADIIRHLMLLPEETRDDYVIEKAGDREYSAAEAAHLAARSDFPRE
ncbi:hypothetical protein [Erythrobacter litoralis]|uniref:Uncharacterized protein n=1 Tax=Erythrobacter litoralis (strain HTCC2594) TaxID=314225 RepID=Q2N9Z9_ERYLH|nr:hypothetical protein [Erythrobacter litoralis]ABC63492.1 hypothetical protein ELI_07000 [Erythrobacter litoralis HTCC2594]